MFYNTGTNTETQKRWPSMLFSHAKKDPASNPEVKIERAEPHSENSDPIAWKILASKRESGKHVEESLEKAVKRYREAAIQGDAESQLILGMLYMQG